jgi:predicted 3-demethylubiquinone-9 3-methyltransferase (glyoxalase superfamily)
MGARRIERAVALADKVDRILASKPEDHEAYRHIGWLRDRLGIE